MTNAKNPGNAAAAMALFAGVLMGACGSDPAEHSSDGSALCAKETRADTYADGLQRLVDGTATTIQLLKAVPGPPDRGDNVFRFLVQDNATPRAQGSLRMRAWMPDHGHGTSPLINPGTPAQATGEFEVGPFDLFMGGLWEFTVYTETATGTPEQTAVFRFCVEG